MQTMTAGHQLVLGLSCCVILAELGVAAYYFEFVVDWVSHNLWVVIVPFLKAIFKRVLALKFVVFLKAVVTLLFHLSKLFVLKILKTLSVRYGVFFSQNRWYWIRRTKVMFLRRGKQFFRAASRFWSTFGRAQQWLIFIAFFPVVLLLFLLGLSFNVTRKTMVQKTQETAIFQMATSASNNSQGIRAWIARLDQATLERIRALTPRARPAQKMTNKVQK